MNLFFRLVLTLVKCIFSPKIDPLAESHLTFRVLPFDLDINLHLTNSRYLSFMDLGRLFFVGQTRLMKTMVKRIWQPVVASCETCFISQVRLFSKIHMHTKLVGWDDKYQYFYQRFTINDKIVATALVKTALYCKGRAVSSKEIVQELDPNIQSPKLPLSVELLKQLSDTKRNLHG